MSTEVAETELNNSREAQPDENDLSNSDIVTKYRTASNIANMALKKVLDEAKPGVSVRHLCELGDKTMLEECAKMYNKKENGRKVSSQSPAGRKGARTAHVRRAQRGRRLLLADRRRGAGQGGRRAQSVGTQNPQVARVPHRRLRGRGEPHAVRGRDRDGKSGRRDEGGVAELRSGAEEAQGGRVEHGGHQGDREGRSRVQVHAAPGILHARTQAAHHRGQQILPGHDQTRGQDRPADVRREGGVRTQRGAHHGRLQAEADGAHDHGLQDRGPEPLHAQDLTRTLVHVPGQLEVPGLPLPPQVVRGRARAQGRPPGVAPPQPAQAVLRDGRQAGRPRGPLQVHGPPAALRHQEDLGAAVRTVRKVQLRPQGGGPGPAGAPGGPREPEEEEGGAGSRAAEGVM